MGYFNFYTPIYDTLPFPRLTLKEIYNPLGVIFRLKASRKNLRRRR